MILLWYKDGCDLTVSLRNLAPCSESSTRNSDDSYGSSGGLTPTTPIRINPDKPFTESEESIINEQPSALIKELDEFAMTPSKTLDHQTLCKSSRIRKPPHHHPQCLDL